MEGAHSDEQDQMGPPAKAGAQFLRICRDELWPRDYRLSPGFVTLEEPWCFEGQLHSGETRLCSSGSSPAMLYFSWDPGDYSLGQRLETFTCGSRSQGLELEVRKAGSQMSQWIFTLSLVTLILLSSIWKEDKMG